MGFLDGIDHVWLWLILGVILLTAEMLAPGYFLIWLGLAAFATALIAGVADIGFGLQVVIFAVFSGFSVVAARHWLSLYPIESSDPLMNDRGARLVGETVVVSRAIEGGSGRVKHGDSEWIARGADAEVGARLVVTGHDGAMLLVGPADAPHIAGSPTNPPSVLP